MALLDAIGRGLSAAGATLNPAVYQDQAAQQLYQQRLQQQQQLAQQKQIAAQKTAAANLVIKAVQSGGLDPNVGNQKLQQLGYGNLAGIVSASPEAKANQQFLQLLNGQQAGQAPTQTPQSGLGTVTGLRGGLNIPASVLASSPLAQKFIEARKTLSAINQPKAPPIRKRIAGGQEIQEQLMPDGTWQQIGSGPRFKPGADTVVNMNLNNKDQLKFTGELSDRYSRDVKPLSELQLNINKAKSLAAEDTPAGDIALQQTLTQLSRGARSTNAQMQAYGNFGDLPQKIVGKINRFLTGKYTPEQRQQVIELLDQLQNQVVTPSIEGANKYFTGIATRHNLDPRDIIPPTLQIKDKSVTSAQQEADDYLKTLK